MEEIPESVIAKIPGKTTVEFWNNFHKFWKKQRKTLERTLRANLGNQRVRILKRNYDRNSINSRKKFKRGMSE